MMFKWNHLIAGILSATLVFSMAPAGVLASEETEAVQSEAIENVQSEGTETMQSEETEIVQPEATETVQADDQENADSEEKNEADASSEEGSASLGEIESEEESINENNEENTEVSSEENSEVNSEENTEVNSEENAEVNSEEGSEAIIESGGEAGTEAESEENVGSTEEIAEEIEPVVAVTTEEKDAVITDMPDIPVPAAPLQTYDYDLGDDDTRFENFAEHVFFGDSDIGTISAKAKNTGLRLTGNDLVVYTGFRESVIDIAAGNRNSGIVQIPYTNFGVKEYYTAEELGLSYIYDKSQGGWNPDYPDALAKLFEFDSEKVQQCLVADLPFEMFPLTGAFMSNSFAECSATWNSDVGAYCIKFVGPISYYLESTKNFKADGLTEDQDEYYYSIDRSKIQNVLNAATNASQIVSNASSKSDLDKLTYYKDQILDMVDYDSDAANNSSSYDDRNVWTLINVFDGDPDTNVVCEGYSEAFQYLGDLTEFNDDNVCVYSVTGTMSGGTGAGGHKWNIVHMDDGYNYIADITNSESDSVGGDGKLFLKGMSGSPSAGYSKSWDEYSVDVEGGYITYPAGSINYTYDDSMFSVYTTDELTLSAKNYGENKSVDEIADLYGMRLIIRDGIGMQVLVTLLDGYYSDSDYMSFTCNGEEKQVTVRDANTTSIENGEKAYVFEYELWTKHMTDDVTFHMVIDGRSGTDKTYSVRSYVDEAYEENDDVSERTLVASILNYGGYAQQYFDYNTDKLANDGIFKQMELRDDPVIDDPDPDLSEYKYTLEEAEDTKGFHIKQVALLLGTKISMIYLFDFDEGHDSDEFDFSISGTEYVNTESGIQYSEEYGHYYMLAQNIMPADLGTMFEFEVTDSDGNTVCKLRYGPLSYCKNKIENGSEKIKNLCKAIYYYFEQVRANYGY